jgi:hypothetical protein
MSLNDMPAACPPSEQADTPASRPKRRSFSAAYKKKIVEAYDALPEGSSERGGLLRREGLYHSHIEYWRKSRDMAAEKALSPRREKSDAEVELAQLRSEHRKLQAKYQKAAAELGKTKTALDIAGKAFALLEGISESADSELT